MPTYSFTSSFYKRPRDFQRRKVYTAEHAVWRLDDTYTDMQDLTRFIYDVIHHTAVVGRYGVMNIRVEKCPGNRMRGVAIRRYGERSIVIPKWARFSSYILHEIAHHYTTEHISSHGREFCKVNLFLHYVILGKEAYEKLKSSYSSHGVSYSEPEYLPEMNEMTYAEAAGPKKENPEPKPRVERIVVKAVSSENSEWEKEKREAEERLRKMMDEL